jgi:hypothetical protein
MGATRPLDAFSDAVRASGDTSRRSRVDELQLAAALARIEDLERQVASAKKDSSTSSKPPSSDIVKFDRGLLHPTTVSLSATSTPMNGDIAAHRGCQPERLEPAATLAAL